MYLEMRLDLCMDPDVLYRRLPDSSLQSIGAIYAHAVITEDHWLRRWRAGGPLYEKETWAELGLPTQIWLDPSWAAGFAPAPQLLRAYAAAVYASTDERLVDLSDAELDEATRISVPDYEGANVVIRERDVSALFAIVDNVVLHMSEHAGEISALLGVQGLRATAW